MRSKKILFWLIILAFNALLIEAISFLYVKKFESSDIKYHDKYIEGTRDEVFKGAWNLRYKAHPYFGYACDKTLHSMYCNDEGVATNRDLSVEKKNNELVIGIFGGSVAQSIGFNLEDNNEKWAKILGAKKNVKFINFSTGGYKHPQIYFQLVYFVDLIDVAIIIDGANDAGHASFPIYPLDYPKLMFRLFESPYNDYFDKFIIKVTRRMYSAYSNFLLESKIINKSHSLYVVWKGMRFFGSKIVFSLSKELRSERVEDKSTPHIKLSREKVILKKIENWKKYVSLSLSLNSENKKIFHFIQPTPFVEGSKEFSIEELKLVKDTRYRGPHKRVYNGFRSESKKLLENKHNSYDLTMIFREVKEQVYIDDFCHVNSYGEKILINKIFDIIGSNVILQ